nr:MAG TPA: hypothetical protein [Microviridae sp.]
MPVFLRVDRVNYSTLPRAGFWFSLTPCFHLNHTFFTLSSKKVMHRSATAKSGCSDCV